MDNKENARVAIYASDCSRLKIIPEAQVEYIKEMLFEDNTSANRVKAFEKPILVETYIDHDACLNFRMPKRAWKRMISDAKNGLFEYILCMDASVIAVSPVERLRFIREIKHELCPNNVCFYFVIEGLMTEGDYEIEMGFDATVEEYIRRRYNTINSVMNKIAMREINKELIDDNITVSYEYLQDEQQRAMLKDKTRIEIAIKMINGKESDDTISKYTRFSLPIISELRVIAEKEAEHKHRTMIESMQMRTEIAVNKGV